MFFPTMHWLGNRESRRRKAGGEQTAKMRLTSEMRLTNLTLYACLHACVCD